MQQTAFPRFQDSDYIFLAEEDLMQHQWLKKAKRLFLQTLADLPDLWSWSHLFTGRKGYGASELRILQFARWPTNPCVSQITAVYLGNERRISADRSTVGRMQTAGLLRKVIWKRQRPQNETAVTAASRRLVGWRVPSFGLPEYHHWLNTTGRKVWPMLPNPFEVTNPSENNRLPQRFWSNLRKHVGVESRAPTGCLGWQRSLATPLLRCSMSQWLSPHVWDSR